MTFDEWVNNRDAEDLRSLLKEAWGRRVLWRILKQCRIFENPAVFGITDQTAFNVGKQDVGRYIMKVILEVKPDAYMEMTKIDKEIENARDRFAKEIDPDSVESE